MKKILNTLVVLIIIAALAGGVAYWLASHHVVRGDDGVMVLKKRFLTFEDTCADIRGWTIRDFDEHMQIRRALVAEGYGELISDLKQKELKGSVNDIIETTESQLLQIKRTVDDWLINLTRGKDRTEEPPELPIPADVPPAGGPEE